MLDGSKTYVSLYYKHALACTEKGKINVEKTMFIMYFKQGFLYKTLQLYFSAPNFGR